MSSSKNTSPATKADLKSALKNYPTKADLKSALKNYPTKADLKSALKNYPTKADLKFALKEYATKADLMETISHFMESVDSRFDQLITYIDKKQAETMRHFDVVAENIRHELTNANHDEISVLKDAKQDHGRRLNRLEQVVGLAA